MNCPTCAAEADARQPRCGSCGVDLLEALEHRAWTSQVATAARAHSKRAVRSRAMRRSRLGWAAAAAGTAALAFGFSAFLAHRRPLPADARLLGPCAYRPLAGWREEPPPAAGLWHGLARLSDGAAAIEVLSAPAGLDVSARNSAGADSAASSAFNGIEPRIDQSRPVVVDGLKGVSLSVSANRAYALSRAAGSRRGGSQPAPEIESQPFQGVLVLLPARGATLVVRGSGPVEAAALRRAVEAFCARLLVLDRPMGGSA